MKVRQFPSYESMSHYCSQKIVKFLRERPDLLFCTAAGRSPTLSYQLLSDIAQQSRSLFEKIRVVKLDEWVLEKGVQCQSCEQYIENYVLNPLKISRERYLGFDGRESPELEVARIRRRLAHWGRIDLCLIGLGLNGHIGFIEPGETLDPGPHIATLQASSRQHPMVKEAIAKPKYGLTLGIVDILHSAMVILLVHGEEKRKVFKQLLTRQLSTRFPASLLWLHRNAYCLADDSVL